MSSGETIFSIDGFVEVSHEPDLDAVWIRYFRLYDEHGKNIPAAVRAAAQFARENNLPNWIADTWRPDDGLSEKDAAWVATQEFRDILLDTSLTTFVLVPSDPAKGLDTSWIPEWRDATEAGFNGKIKVHVIEKEEDIRALLK